MGALKKGCPNQLLKILLYWSWCIIINVREVTRSDDYGLKDLVELLIDGLRVSASIALTPRHIQYNGN